MPRRYHVWLPVEQALAMDFQTAVGQDPALPNPPIPPSYSLVSPAWGVPFTLWPVTRHAEYLGHDKSANWPDGVVREHCNLTVTYEGHVCLYPPSQVKGGTHCIALEGGSTTGAGFFNGVVASRFEQGTKSEQILVSYDLNLGVPIGSPGYCARTAIGPNNEGTNRLIPSCRWLITQNLQNCDYGVMEDIIQGLIGTVNESGWTDPVYGDPWWPGVWLYLGPQTVENRDGTYTLVHQFDYDLHDLEAEAMMTTTGGAATWYSHKFAWYDLQESKVLVGAGIYKIRKTPIQPLRLSTIYPTAGATAVKDVNGNLVESASEYMFADLFRPYNGPEGNL